MLKIINKNKALNINVGNYLREQNFINIRGTYRRTMCCNNFGYFTNILSQMMLPMLMMRGMYSGCGHMGGYSPYSVFMQPYSPMPMMSGYSGMSFPFYANNLYNPIITFPPAMNYAPASVGGYLPSVSNYFDFLNTTSLSSTGTTKKPDTNEDKKFYVNTDENGVKRNPFDAFEAMEEIAEELGYEKAKKHTDRNSGVEITNDEWRADANAGEADVEANYMTQVKEFGKSFIKGIDKKHGNNDGVLTYQEFEKYQMEDVPSDADDETKAEMKKSAKIAFDRLNLNGGNTIDAREITALLAAMDYDKNSNVNGIITINDFTRTSVQLASEDKNSLDGLLKNRYNAFFDKNA